MPLTLGTKLEHNDFTGFRTMSRARNWYGLRWTGRLFGFPRSPGRYLATIAPGRENAEIASSIIPMGNGNFGVVELSGNRDLKAETVLDYELGYRNQVNRRMSFDVTTFWSDYTNLRTTEPGTPFFTLDPGPPHLVIPVMWGIRRGRGTTVWSCREPGMSPAAGG